VLFKSFEWDLVEIRNSNNDKFLVGVIYRPPNSNLHIWELFCESVDKALDSDLPLFLVGDYNCDMLSNSSNYFKKDIRSVCSIIISYLSFKGVLLKSFKWNLCWDRSMCTTYWSIKDIHWVNQFVSINYTSNNPDHWKKL
jgi:hypothetical protein